MNPPRCSAFCAARTAPGLLAPILLAVATSFLQPALAHDGVHKQIGRVSKQIEAEKDPVKQAPLYLRRGDLQRIHRDWKAAEEDLARARKLDPALPEVDLVLGRMWLDAGKPEQARPPLDRYLAKKPASVKALVTRAEVGMQVGDALASAADYRRAIALFEAPKNALPEHYVGCAKALRAAGDEHLDEAIEVLDGGMKRLGDIVTLQLAAIELELARGRHDAALRRLETIARQSRRQERWLARRGEILEDAGRKVEAIETYERAMAAIEALPARQGSNRATKRLETSVRAALKRLREDTEAGPGQEADEGRGKDEGADDG